MIISITFVSLVPRSHPLQGKGSGDIETFSWSCTPSYDPIQAYANIHVIPVQTYAKNHMIAELAETRIDANVPRPFPRERGEGWKREKAFVNFWNFNRGFR